MRVGLLVSSGEFSNDLGIGPARYAYELYSNIKLLNYNNFFIDKIEIKSSKLFGIRIPFIIASLFKDFTKYDIIHNLNQDKPFKFFSNKRPLVITTVHDLRPYSNKFMLDDFNKNNGFIYKSLIKYTIFNCALKSDFIIARSSQTKDELIKFGFDKSRIKIINDGVDERFRHASIQHYKNEFFTVGYLGSSEKNKNVKFAIESSKYFDKKTILKVYGKSTETLSKICTKQKNVKIMGFAPEDKLVGIYDSFDAFVFPSYYEGFGIPIIEAQSRGLPVIIYKYGKIPKEVRRYCFEAESPEHMAQIIKNIKENGYNEKLKKKATTYARSFTWEKEAKETLGVYKKVLK